MRFVRNHAAQIATGLLALALYVEARPPAISAEQQATLAAPFKFKPIVLQPVENGKAFRIDRDVNPSLARISGWISSVGAAIALADIEGTGKPADICLVDPRNDSVSVMPAPGTGARFEPFALPLPTEGYDSKTIAPMGCLPGDFNEDGNTDLLVYYWGRTPIIFMREGKLGLSAAAFHPVQILATRERWFTNAAVEADIDGDGHPDLVFGNYFPDGDRILDPTAKDGAEMQHSMSRAYNGGRKHLFLWSSSTADDVVYRDASSALSEEMATGWTLALGAADLNGDLRPEIYVANDFGPDRLLLNQSTPSRPEFQIVEGRRGFFTPRSKVLGRDSFKGMGVDFGSVTGDGRLAIAVSNISAPYALLESHFLFAPTGDEKEWSHGVAPYRDISGSLGVWTSSWGWDIKFADLNNSGYPAILQAIGFLKGETNRWPQLQELAMSNDELLKHPFAWPRFRAGDDISGQDHDRLFVRGADRQYHDIWTSMGLDDHTVSRGVAVADVYGDGKLSVAIARQWMPSIFLRNVSSQAGRAIVIDLRVAGNVAGDRPLIGGTARVTLPDGRIITDRVDGGSGHSGKRAPEIHLGLGAVPPDSAFNVDFSWRDAAGVHRATSKFTPGRYRVLVDGNASLKIMSATGS
jgi:hypothetical protein